jgi:hypothetical protein
MTTDKGMPNQTLNPIVGLAGHSGLAFYSSRPQADMNADTDF